MARWRSVSFVSERDSPVRSSSATAIVIIRFMPFGRKTTARRLLLLNARDEPTVDDARVVTEELAHDLFAHDLRRRSIAREHAVAHDEHAIAVRRRPVQIVRREDDRGTGTI